MSGKTGSEFGYLWFVVVAFAPAAFAAHLWAYQHLGTDQRDTYRAMLLVVYIAPPVIAAAIVVVRRLVLNRIRARYGARDRR